MKVLSLSLPPLLHCSLFFSHPYVRLLPPSLLHVWKVLSPCSLIFFSSSSPCLLPSPSLFDFSVPSYFLLPCSLSLSLPLVRFILTPSSCSSSYLPSSFPPSLWFSTTPPSIPVVQYYCSLPHLSLLLVYSPAFSLPSVLPLVHSYLSPSFLSRILFLLLCSWWIFRIYSYFVYFVMNSNSSPGMKPQLLFTLFSDIICLIKMIMMMKITIITPTTTTTVSANRRATYFEFKTLG